MTRLTAVFLLFALAPSALAQRLDLRAEIQAVNDSMVAAFNTGNMLAVARFYTDDARVDGERSAVVQGRARTSVVEFLAVWRRDPKGGLRLAVDYYRY